MDAKFILGAMLLVCLFLISFPFEKRYMKFIQEYAHHPGARFIAGILLLLLASVDPILGGLAFLVIFLWIADVQLLSSVQFTALK